MFTNETSNYETSVLEVGQVIETPKFKIFIQGLAVYFLDGLADKYNPEENPFEETFITFSVYYNKEKGKTYKPPEHFTERYADFKKRFECFSV